MRRSHTCGELGVKQIGQMVVLQGWVKKIRKMGNKNFVDLRDHYGITQLVLSEDRAKNLKNEYVIEVQGEVVLRKEKNPTLITGEIEVLISDLKLLNRSELPPFQIEDNVSISEETRMFYRYLDLRRPKMQKTLVQRAKINSTIRKILEKLNFLEVETPFLNKSTPEGARDFLIPSRLNKGKFYALPQSPQLFKQLLMVAGFDRYFQIVRCFRDEDFRLDRQPEFTQLDLEMSFATPEDVIFVVETLIKELFKAIKNYDLPQTFKRITYREAIEYYGTDKPDLRYDLKIHTLTHLFKETNSKFLKPLLDQKFEIKGLMIAELLSKSQIAELEETAKQNHLTSLGFAKYENGTWSGSIASQLSDAEKNNLLQEFKIQTKGTILVNGGPSRMIAQAMGAIRTNLGQMFNLTNSQDYEILWVVDFPLFAWNDEEKRYVAMHHPFTMPKKESLKDFDTNPKDALASAYDLVLNGFEIGGGSQRITNLELQQRMFDAIGLSKTEVAESFGWFIEAYKFGAPYHSGIALGLDRISMILSEADSIRDVIAFPKNASGIDPMSKAPDYILDSQLQELGIKFKK